MGKEHISAFVSYSWDGESHKRWVLELTNGLRRKGIAAELDLFITQSGTVNLNQMMIKKLRDSDFIIVVLTESYADKADGFKGGVGYETLLSLPLLQEHPEKLIFITKHRGDFKAVFPFHLRGYYAIDFSDDANYNEAFEELLHRIYNVPLYEMEPIGEIPDLKPRSALQIAETRSDKFFDAISIPNIKGVTDFDKLQYMEWSYQEINRYLRLLFEEIKSSNLGFHYTDEKVTEKKHIYRLFVDGQMRSGVKIWIGNSLGAKTPTISLKFDANLDYNHDGSMNESISCEETTDNRLTLRMIFNLFGEKGPHDPKSIVNEIWRSHLAHHFRN
jgi:hypothetical protein